MGIGDKTVYNLTTSEITADAAWVVIIRTKDGKWIIPPGGSGGGHTIWFTITDVLCPLTDYVEETTLVVTATWYNQSCTGTPPGAKYEGTYNVYDLCSYLNGLTPTDLISGTGRATYHYPLTGTCTPKWIIDDLCPSPECA